MFSGHGCILCRHLYVIQHTLRNLRCPRLETGRLCGGLCTYVKAEASLRKLLRIYTMLQSQPQAPDMPPDEEALDATGIVSHSLSWLGPLAHEMIALGYAIGPSRVPFNSQPFRKSDALLPYPAQFLPRSTFCAFPTPAGPFIAYSFGAATAWPYPALPSPRNTFRAFRPTLVGLSLAYSSNAPIS